MMPNRKPSDLEESTKAAEPLQSKPEGELRQYDNMAIQPGYPPMMILFTVLFSLLSVASLLLVLRDIPWQIIIFIPGAISHLPGFSQAIAMLLPILITIFSVRTALLATRHKHRAIRSARITSILLILLCAAYIFHAVQRASYYLNDFHFDGYLALYTIVPVVMAVTIFILTASSKQIKNSLTE